MALNFQLNTRSVRVLKCNIVFRAGKAHIVAADVFPLGKHRSTLSFGKNAFDLLCKPVAIALDERCNDRQTDNNGYSDSKHAQRVPDLLRHGLTLLS